MTVRERAPQAAPVDALPLYELAGPPRGRQAGPDYFDQFFTAVSEQSWRPATVADEVGRVAVDMFAEAEVDSPQVEAIDALFGQVKAGNKGPADADEPVGGKQTDLPSSDMAAGPMAAVSVVSALLAATVANGGWLSEQQTASRGAAGTRLLRALAGIAVSFYGAVHWGRQEKDRRQGTWFADETPCSER
jgi:hypothetical protein